MKHIGFQHKKSLGQHFLTSAVVPGWMCDAASVQPGDVVVEIGPGTGALTRELLVRGAKVIAIEADTRAIAILHETFATAIDEHQLLIQHGDARQLDANTLEVPAGNYKVVANIPYYLSGFLFRTFLETAHQPSDIIFLVQKEVAKRATAELARNEKESLLSLSIKAYGSPTYVRTVTRGHFEPKPQVDSAIIAIHSINRDAFQAIDEGLFFELLHLGFGKKRKQLLGNLSVTFNRAEILRSFSAVGLPENVRAEDMNITMWLALCRSLAAYN